MGTLAEIEATADQLPAARKQELLLFLAARLRVENTHSPEPHEFTAEQIKRWIADDEAEMREFNEGK